MRTVRQAAVRVVAPLAGILLLAVCFPARAQDAAGLDLTMQVLGKDDRVDDRLVNRIQIPGIGGGQAAAGERVRAEARERQAAREENREARRERREEALERYRERRERPE